MMITNKTNKTNDRSRNPMRHRFLAGEPRWFNAATVLCLALVGITPALAQDSGPGVVSDTARLRAVIVMSIDDSIFRSLEMGSSIHPIFNKGLPRGTIEQHAALVRLLRENGVDVLQVRDLLDDAIESAREDGVLDDWIRETHPAYAEVAVEHLDRLNADILLHRSDEFFYRKDDDGQLEPLFPPVSSMYWSRDFAVSTPKGIIIGNGQAYGRSLENAMARLMFQHADALSDFPIVFDAGAEGVLLDGGDIIVKDENTLLLGVGQRSSVEAAPLLAKRLGMDVIAVQMPPADRRSGLSRQLLHLDSIFNIIDDDKVIAVPYFLENEFTNSNPMAKILTGLAQQTDAILEGLDPERFRGNSRQLRLTVEVMPDVGKLTRYEADSGTATEMDFKLVDYARDQGYTVIYVGGEKGALSTEKWTVERAMYELRWQGVNVAQLAPGKVIAYGHNVHTNAALKKAGIEVLTFDGELLSMRNGGPHCLIMPLVRR